MDIIHYYEIILIIIIKNMQYIFDYLSKWNKNN